MSAVPPPESDDLPAFIDRHLDRQYLVATLRALAKVPTDVPLGWDTLMEPDDPRLVYYVQQVLRPELARLGLAPRDVPRNNLVVELGSGVSGESLLLQTYTPAQHHQLMEDPFSGDLRNAPEYGCDEPAVFGLGVSQAKAHQAAMLAVLKLLQETRPLLLQGRLYWAVNNEGRSSHACSEAILAALPELPHFCVLQVDTGLGVSLGNRGRVDVAVHVRGRASHSSAPHLGLSAIEGAAEVVRRLRALSWPDRHPLLGGRHAVPYKVRFEPVAPHTLPSDAYIVVDRRLLPGDDLDVAADEIRAAIGDMAPYEVTTMRDVFMLPALVDSANTGVQALLRSHRAVCGRMPATSYGQGSFDAGGLVAHGVPAVMYGCGGGDGLLGADFVPVSAVETEARVLAHLILSLLQ
jgi:acetylornithine deacetylase/succinyl-diaminopimelate desuccinylase-like protein